jgi:hypothetical protein
MKKIMAEQRIIARDQNKVFVERANTSALAPVQAQARFNLHRGKANAYIEFDIEDEELGHKYNRRIRAVEFYIQGNVELSGRNAAAQFNY